MDIDDFLDRELSDVDSGPIMKKSGGIDAAQLNESFEPSPLFDDIKSSLEKGNLDEAEQTYMQLWHVLAQENFKWDKTMYEQIEALSRQISSNMNLAFSELKTKSDHINELILRARSSLREGKKDSAFKIYGEITAINSSIPGVFFEERKLISDQILAFYQELKSSNDAELLKRIDAMIKEINAGIDRINSLLQKGDLQGATIEYTKSLKTYNQIPSGFLKHRGPLGLRLLDIYKNISISNEISNLQKQISSGPRNFAPMNARMQTSVTLQKHEARPLVQEQKTAGYEVKSKTEPTTQVKTLAKEIPKQSTGARKEIPRRPLRKKYESSIEAVSALTKEPAQGSLQNPEISQASQKGVSSSEKITSAKKNFERGLYNEASKDVEEALTISPSDVEAKALRAKIKAWQ